jgi:hypothetical protein
MASTDSPKTVLLWGATQVGKTALLAAALYGNEPDLSAVQVDRLEQLHGHLFEVWRRLKNNQWVPPTERDWTGIKLSGADGAPVELRDIRGGVTHELNQIGPQQLLESCDAILFMVEYNGRQSADQIVAIDGAFRAASRKPFALAFTKCERWITYHDAIWDRQGRWIESTPLWKTHQGTLARFGNHIWPTSTFGYEATVGLPSVIVGEMGQLLPFRIAPKNVAKPLAFLLRELGCL